MSETIPTQAEIVTRALESRIADIFTSMVGRVDSYDRASQTADITPVIREPVPKVDGSFSFEELPQIPNVPVLFPRSGNGVAIIWDLPKDTHVVLCITKLAIAEWRKSGSISDPVDFRKHHPGSCIAIPGIEANNDAINFAQEGKLIIHNDGDILLGKNAAERIARADRVEAELNKLSSDVTVISTHTHAFAGTGTVLMSTQLAPPGSLQYTTAPTENCTACDKVYGE